MTKGRDFIKCATESKRGSFLLFVQKAPADVEGDRDRTAVIIGRSGSSCVEEGSSRHAELPAPPVASGRIFGSIADFPRCARDDIGLGDPTRSWNAGWYLVTYRYGPRRSMDV